MKGPSLQLDLRVQRTWVCPACGRTVRTSGRATSRTCACADPPVFMTLREPPQHVQFDVSKFVHYEDPALDVDDDAPDGLDEATAAVLAAIAARVEANPRPVRMGYTSLSSQAGSFTAGTDTSDDGPESDLIDDFAAEILPDGPLQRLKDERPTERPQQTGTGRKSENESRGRGRGERNDRQAPRSAPKGRSHGSRPPDSAQSGPSRNPASEKRPDHRRKQSPVSHAQTDSSIADSDILFSDEPVEDTAEHDSTTENAETPRVKSRRRRRRKSGISGDKQGQVPQSDTSGDGHLPAVHSSHSGATSAPQSSGPGPTESKPLDLMDDGVDDGEAAETDAGAAETPGTGERRKKRGRRRGRRRPGSSRPANDSPGSDA